MRLVTFRQQQELDAELAQIMRASYEKTRLMGRMLKCLRQARDCMLKNRPVSDPRQPKTMCEREWDDAISQMNALLERKP